MKINYLEPDTVGEVVLGEERLYYGINYESAITEI